MTRIKVAQVVLLTLILAFSVGCGLTTISPGNVGIVVEASGSQRGVQDFPVRTGRVWYNPINETVIEYPAFIQTVVWSHDINEGHPVNEEITFTNKDSMVIAVDVNMSYHLEAEKVPDFYVHFRLDDIDKFTHGFLRNIARDCMNEVGGEYSIDQIMGDNAKFLADARQCLQARVKDYGVVIDSYGLIGAPRPPQQVIDAINAKVHATQLAIQKENEVKQAQADAQKAVAEAQGRADSLVVSAKGEAEANRIKSSSIDDKLIQWYKLTNQHDQIWRWNGKLPQVQAGSGTGLLLQVPTQDK